MLSIPSSTVISGLKYLVGTSAAISILLSAGLWYFQTSLIYPSGYPKGSREHVPVPTDVGLPYEDVTLTCSDGVKLKAYVIPARLKPLLSSEIRQMTSPERKERVKKEMAQWIDEMGREESINYAKSRPTVVIFHANAGNMGHRVPIARHFNVELGCNVFMLSYRGYGMSEGRASEKGMRIDAQTAMAYISSHPLLRQTKIILYGQSIGGAVCLDVASALPGLPSGVIVENTFVSLPVLIPQVLPALPKLLLPILLTEKWDATLTLPRIPSTTPILFLAGRRDELIPPSHMQQLLNIRGKGRARWRDFDGGHNDTWVKEGYWDAIEEWLKEEVLAEKADETSGYEEDKRVEDEGALDEKVHLDGGWEKVEINTEIETKKMV